MYLKPFYTRNEGTAIREIKQALEGAQPNDVAKNAQDLELFSLGEYDDSTGKYDTHPPRHVLNLLELIDKPE